MVLASLALPATAYAAAGDKAAAEALFTEGRRLMDAGRFAEACPKFESSQRLDPGVGTMLNLAECYEKTGRTASAWAEFREVISAAKAAESVEREELARQRATVLEKKLSRLTIALSVEAASTPNIEVRRDGLIVDSGELSSPIPVDPGKHVVEATAPGKLKWFKTVELSQEGGRETVNIPELEPVGGSSVSGSAPSNVEGAPAASPGNSRKTIGLVTGGVGLVGIGLGAVFGLRASSKLSDAKSHCTSYPNVCDQGAKDPDSQAKSAATLSTVFFIVGGAAVATGAVLWLTAGSASESKVAVGVGPDRLLLKGRF
jgi:hypothetical protein